MKKRSANKKPATKSSPSKKVATNKSSKETSKSVPFKPVNSGLFPIVGIGASAGGLEASVELLKKLPDNLGMAYVFIHHLSPGYNSNLKEILKQKAFLPVENVTDGVAVEPDHAYVILPNTFISLEKGVFKVSKRSKLDVPYHPIDHFLISLAGNSGDKAIGIILSGTATDGTLGLRSVKEAGGFTMVQDHTAKHQEMPRNAHEAGFADFILSPALMVAQLSSLTRHPYVAVPSHESTGSDEDAVKKILNTILVKRGVDFFSHYKRNTVLRRVLRRMALFGITDFKEYFKKLKGDEGEVDALFQDFLINVTSFFREPAFYAAMIKYVFPSLILRLKPSEPIRIWIAGCATGEEAYSTAICLAEFLHDKKRGNPVHIFSTDLNTKAIERARLGVYPKDLLQHLSTQRLRKFFVKVDGYYQIIKSIREMCIFSQHNLLKDPPFSRMDIVSCQNVLIYLEPGPQRGILQAFHYALKPSGFLLLGKSESIGNAVDLFQTFEKDPRLYIKKQGVVQRLDFGARNFPPPPAAAGQIVTLRVEGDVEKESDKLLLTRYVPASVLVNKDLEIIRFRGSTAPYLSPASGKASLNLLKMVRDELLFDLKAAIQEAKKTGSVAVQENVLSDSSKTGMAVNIEVAPLNIGKQIYYLVVFREMMKETTRARGPASSQATQAARVLKLEQALINARDQLRSTSEEFDSTREELQSANEEILSSNEELQSINEELETSKEELQSSNEELTTINEELQVRNHELKLAHSYASAIIDTMRGPLMVLNTEMRVRTANRAFLTLFRLAQDETEGRLLHEIGDADWDIPALRDQLQDMLRGKLDFKDFAINHDFSAIGNRIMIINAHRLVSDEARDESLILLSFEDITRYKKAEQSLLETQQQLKLALGGGSVGTWAWNIRTNEIITSSEEARLYGLQEDRPMQTYDEWERTVHPLDLAYTRQALKQSIGNGVPLDIEFRIRWLDGSTHWILSKANTYLGADGKPEKMMGVNIDITERMMAIEALEESEKRFHSMSDNAPVMIWMAGPDRKINFLNKTWLSFRGKTLEEEFGGGWFEGIHSEDKKIFLDVYNNAFDSQKEFKIDYRLKRHDGEYRWIMTHGVPRFAGEKDFLGFIGTCIDISDRIDLERQKDDFMGIASHELKTPVTSIKAYAQILQEKFRKANDPVSSGMLGRLDLQIDKLTGLINTLLDVAKVQSGQMDYFHEWFDIKGFVREVTEEIQATFPRHTIVTDLVTDGKVFADKPRLTQVLNNLLANAVKYSPEGREVIVGVRREESNYVFSVRDFGVGIPRDMQEKVFGRFFRVSESSGNRASGLGLGLFISSQIIKQHGGKFWLESEPGQGSTFFFSLPAKSD